MSDDSNIPEKSLEQRVENGVTEDSGGKQTVHIAIYRAKFDEIKAARPNLSYEDICRTIARITKYSTDEVDLFYRHSVMPVPKDLYTGTCVAEECLTTGILPEYEPEKKEINAGAATVPSRTREEAETPAKEAPAKKKLGRPRKNPDEEPQKTAKKPAQPAEPQIRTFPDHHLHLGVGIPLKNIPYYLLEAVVDALADKEAKTAIAKIYDEKERKMHFNKAVEAIEKKAAQRRYFSKGELTRLLRRKDDCAPPMYGGLIAMLAEHQLGSKEMISVSHESLRRLTKPTEYNASETYAIGQILEIKRKDLCVVLETYPKEKTMIVARRMKDPHDAAQQGKRAKPKEKDAAEKKDPKKKSYVLQEYRTDLRSDAFHRLNKPRGETTYPDW